MPYIEVTVGPSSSGKSTYAEAEVKKWRGQLVEVNRDTLRRATFGIKGWSDYKFTKENENLITELAHRIIYAAMDTGKSVIISDTNLNPDFREVWKQIADGYGVEYREIWFNVPAEELHARNEKRGRWKVKPDILDSMITRFNEQYSTDLPTYSDDYQVSRHKQYIPDTTLPKAVIFDVDGTLADHTDVRGPFDLSKVSLDKPRYNVINHAMDVKGRRIKVIVMSGRQDSCQSDTAAWLRKFGVPFDELIMRETGDLRNDGIVKEELFYKHVAEKYNVLYCVDDRDRVVETWRGMGLECWQVQAGDF